MPKPPTMRMLLRLRPASAIEGGTTRVMIGSNRRRELIGRKDLLKESKLNMGKGGRRCAADLGLAPDESVSGLG
jgi:hypothetical protein